MKKEKLITVDTFYIGDVGVRKEFFLGLIMYIVLSIIIIGKSLGTLI